ncbi:MAG: hypothetical protein EBZ77_15285 [Chitinophagia bacterium]|nr:hypothetical protein [Chitinophagia bacterium]
MAKQQITYHWGANSLTIDIGNRTDKRIRILYLFELLFTTGVAALFFVRTMGIHQYYLQWISAIGASTLVFLAVRRLLLRVFYSETVILDDKYITFVRKNLFAKNVRRYDWRLLGPLHYEGKARKTDHPLKGKYFDYFGFESQEQLIQSLHHEGNLFFDNPGGRLYFAFCVYSWDAEEMVQMMKMYMGVNLTLGPEWQEMLQAHELGDA